MSQMRKFCLLASLTALFSLSCSDPEPPTPRGAAQYRTFVPPQGKAGCSIGWGGIAAQEPYVEGDPTGVPEMPRPAQPPSRRGGPVYDGVEGNEISCKVIGGDQLEISARLAGPNVSPSTGRPGSNTHLDISAKLDSKGKGTGHAAFYTTDTLAVRPTDEFPCTFEAVPEPSTGEPILEAGAIWLTFNCPRVHMSSQNTSCSSEGVLVLEDCQK